MNNEPVAVYINKDDGLVCAKCFNPLYTHPAKTLTDEEIQELALSDEFWISEDCTIFDWHKFARAILKKASEK
jgi:Zn-finger protein